MVVSTGFCHLPEGNLGGPHGIFGVLGGGILIVWESLRSLWAGSECLSSFSPPKVSKPCQGGFGDPPSILGVLRGCYYPPPKF